MSYRTNQHYKGDSGGADMTKQRSSDSSYSLQSSMSNLGDEGTGSPCTVHSSELEDPSSLDFPYTDSMRYGSFETYQYLQHDQLDNHLALSNPNGNWPPDVNNSMSLPLSGPSHIQSYGYGRHQQSRDDGHATYTPKSLRWPKRDMKSILQSYIFCVPEGKESKNPYFELREGEVPTDFKPARVYLDAMNDPEARSYKCAFPTDECVDKRGNRKFCTRAADLGRHYLHVHTPRHKQKMIICGYAGCDRKSTYPLYRKDHYRDHLRDYHKEDLGEPKRVRKDTPEEREARERAWHAERRIVARNWRCVKCLHNNRSGGTWVCSECCTPCEDARREKRIQLLREKEEKPKSFVCRVCNGCGYDETTFAPCPECTQLSFTSFEDFDTPMFDTHY